MIANIRGRIGICFLFTSVVFLVYGALLLIHRPDEKEEEELRYQRVLRIREQRIQEEADQREARAAEALERKKR